MNIKQCCVSVAVWQQYTLCGKPCTGLFLSLFFESETANTTLWRRLQTVGLVLEKTFLLKHLHLSHLPAYIQHLQKKWAAFQPPVEEQEDLFFSVPWALVAVCSQVGAAAARLGLSQGSGDAQWRAGTPLCVIFCTSSGVGVSVPGVSLNSSKRNQRAGIEVC